MEYPKRKVGLTISQGDRRARQVCVTAPGLGELEIYRGRNLRGKVDYFSVAQCIWDKENLYQ